MKDNPIWIWRAGETLTHEFVRFKRIFTSNTESVEIKLSADTDFSAYLDGKEVMRGQFSDYPEEKTFSTVNIDLNEGEHTLEVSVYYSGIDFLTYIAGNPGFWAEIKLKSGSIISDEQWLCRRETAYLRDRIDKVTPQMGFSVGYDARLEDSPEPWENAVPAEQRPQPSARPVPLLENGAIVHGKLVNQGYFRRNNHDCAYALSCATDSLFPMLPHQVLEGNFSTSFAAPGPEAPWKFKPLSSGFDGYFLTIDLGQEIVGLEEFEWELPAGTIVDIAFGEHLTDCRVRCEICDRFFGDRYIAKGGRQHYTMPRRVGLRYMELHIIPTAGEAVVYAADLRPRRAVLPPPSAFSCDDDQLMAMCRNSVRTLELCMHEHYEDCPWREQALYAYDSRNQILYGNYIWDNYRFAAASLELLGKGLREEGVVSLCAPAKVGPPICIFSFAWIMEICEYVLYSGDRSLLDRMESVCRIIIDRVLTRFDAGSGLYATPPEKGLWHFYEWREELGGNGATPGKPDALYNLYFLEALDGFAKAAGDPLLQDKADALRKAVFKAYYNPDLGCMMTYENNPLTHEITQVLALYNNCVPEPEKQKIINGLLKKEHIKISSSSIRYYYAALLQEGKELRKFLSEKIWNDFGMMVQGASTTMWETDLGEEDFLKAGSLCHGWSALPVWYFYAIKLGLKPLTPGWKTFEIAPVEFTGMEAFGEVPTPAGTIFLRISRTDSGLVLECTGPESLTPVFRPWAPEEYISATWNGKSLM